MTLVPEPSHAENTEAREPDGPEDDFGEPFTFDDEEIEAALYRQKLEMHP